MKRRCAWLLAALLLVPLMVLSASPAASAQSCGISLTAQPSHVSFPFGAVPAPGAATFGETFDVAYPPSLANQTVRVQYLNGSRWHDLENFAANAMGFTETSYGLDSGWVRFGTTSVRAVSGLCESGTAVFGVSYDPGAAWMDAGAYAAVIAFAGAFLFLGKSLGWKRFLIVAVPVYLAITPWTGQRYDVYFLLSSGIRILQHVNPFAPGNPPLYPGGLKWAYPPLYALYSALSFLIYRGLSGAPLPSVGGLTWPGWLTAMYNVYLAYVPSSLPLLVSLLKLPMVASAVLTGAFLNRMTRSGWTGVFWLANPLVILVAAVWGQLDPMAALLTVMALYYFGKGKMYHAYLLASLGAAVKVWPIIIIPLMLAITLRREGVRAFKPLSACIPAFAATLAILGAYGNLAYTVYVFLYARAIPTYGGVFTANGLTWQQALLLVKAPPVPVFLLAGVPAYVACLLWVYWKKDADLVKWTVISILVFFLTYNFVNPQYFYWILPLLILQRRRIAGAVFTVLPLAYVALTYNLFYFVSPAVLMNQFSVGASVADQFKVDFFSQTPVAFLVLTAVVPTVIYALLLLSELRPGLLSRRVLRRGLPEDEEGLVSEPVKGRDARERQFEALEEGQKRPQPEIVTVEIGRGEQGGKGYDLRRAEPGGEVGNERRRREISRRHIPPADGDHYGLDPARIRSVELQDEAMGYHFGRAGGVPDGTDEIAARLEEGVELTHERTKVRLAVQGAVERVCYTYLLLPYQVPHP